MVPQRIKLEKVIGIQTCYKDKKGNYLDSKWLGEGNLASPLVKDALFKLKDSIELEGGTFRVSDIFRTWDQQAKAKKDKPTLANSPGSSYHQSGNGVDIDTNSLQFPTPKSQWIEQLWQITKPLGFHSVISRPEWIPENWHFQFYGPEWEEASLKIPSFELAKCLILDCGKWDINEDSIKVQKMFVQAQLIRLGYYQIGKVDGIIGVKTNKVVQDMKLDKADLDTLCVLLAQSKRIKI